MIELFALILSKIFYIVASAALICAVGWFYLDLSKKRNVIVLSCMTLVFSIFCTASIHWVWFK
jgi:hypothetical protein